MRVLASILTAAVMAVAIAGCSKSTTEQTAPATTMAPQAAATTAMMPKTNQKMAAMSSETKLPMYPGAKTEAAGSSGMMGTGSAAGSVMSTADSFDKVYKWYQSHMPVGSEKSHASVGGTETAVFLIGAAGKTQQSVTISRTPATSGKTMITLAKVTK
jgi:hypothetical protein